MNLIQTQERLKDLPSNPQTVQALLAYANGANPQVPPYLALGELNRRKQMMEKAQMQQAPQGTVKDQVAQATGIMALQQGRQQQGMQQMAQGAGQQMGQVPPQVAQAGPVQMARGGIVAFAGGTTEEDIRRMSDAQDARYRVESGQGSADDLLKEGIRRALVEPPKKELPDEREARLIRENPERYGALNTPIGQTAMKQLEMLQEAQRAELARQREEAAQSRPGILQLLGQAAAGTRGRSGRDAFAAILGGYSDLSGKADAEARKGEQALRQKELEMLQAKSDLTVKVDDLRRAKAEGSLKAQSDAINALADEAAKRNLDVAKILREAGASQAQIDNWKATAAGAAETRAETRRHNLADEAIRRAQNNREDSYIQRARVLAREEKIPLGDALRIVMGQGNKAEQRRAEVMRILQNSDMYKNAQEAIVRLSSRPTLTPDQQQRLDVARTTVKTLEDNADRYVFGGERPANAGPVKVTVGGKQYEFPDQKSADQFKAAAGAK